MSQVKPTARSSKWRPARRASAEPDILDLPPEDLILPVVPKSRRIVRAKITLRKGQLDLIIPESLLEEEG
ncbi:MAG: hypothetical protein ACE15C_13120 [Phycisphaerae bacterium]